MLETLLASARAAVPGRRAASDAREAARARRSLRWSGRCAAQGKSIELVCAATGRGWRVEADVVERILSPLLENAARYARAARSRWRYVRRRAAR